MAFSRLFLALALTAILVFGVFGCGSDDDDKGTTPTTQQMTNEQAVAQVTSSLYGGGIEIILGAVSSARSDWDGYQPPDIEGTLDGGLGKILMPNDTIWGDTTGTGWIVFFADAHYDDYDETEDATISADFVVADSVMFKEGNVPNPVTTDPDFLDMRTHGDFDIDYSDPEGSLSMGLNFYQKVTLDQQSTSTIVGNLDEVFTLSMDGDLPTTEAVLNPDEEISIEYNYSVAVRNLTFTSADDYTCPVSGTMTVTVSVLAKDETATYSGSATATLTISSGGSVTGTVVSGNYYEYFSYTGFCTYVDGSPFTALDKMLQK